MPIATDARLTQTRCPGLRLDAIGLGDLAIASKGGRFETISLPTPALG